MKKLIKSYKFWTTLAGAVGLLVVSFAKIFGYSISSNGIEEFIMAICGVLVVLGVVKKPKSKQKDETIDNKEKNKIDTTEEDNSKK